MARHKGSKFSFPLPGRKPPSKSIPQDGGHDRIHHLGPPPALLSSAPSVPFSTRYHQSPSSRHDHNASNSAITSSSKAQRVLGTDGPPFRSSSKQTPPIPPPSPAYITVTLSEAGSDYDARSASDFTSHQEYRLPKAVALSNRASSTILPPSSMPYGSDRPASPSSTASRQLRPRASDSTMHSHYDARSSPLSISQQTSNSAVRDMALRKGKPRVLTSHSSESGNEKEHSVSSPLAHDALKNTPVKNNESNRRSNTLRLDLAKLFPKPRSNGGQEYDKNLLSPSKLVDSPTALSTFSDYFPRPMSREPTPTPRGQSKLTKARPQQNSSAQMVKRQASLTRLYKRDQYDHAKINVRRPPPGIKHWFDGFDEDSDEFEEDNPHPVNSQKPTNPYDDQQNNASLGRLGQGAGAGALKTQQPHVAQQLLDPRKGQYLFANSHLANRLTSPSQASLKSQSSQTTAKTKDSSLSRTNLQNSSVLSFSSSEDEGDSDMDSNRGTNKVVVRDSINIADHGDIVIGRAQEAFPVRPPHKRKSSIGKLSVMSTSTTAATIEVMYTPEPYSAQQFPRHHFGSSQSTGSSRRSSHVRQQPSIIREVESEDARPKTAVSPQSPSSRSVRTSTSEPRSRLEAQKFMAVTPEEEALLEALRKKRAAMVQQSWVEGYATAIKNEEVIRQVTPPEAKQKPYRTSAFLSVDSPPSQSPVRTMDAKKSIKKAPAPLQTHLSSSSLRGRRVHAKNSSGGISIGGDGSRDDTAPDCHVPADEATLARRLSPPEFSPLDLFPVPSNRLSVISQSTTDHVSLPSPVTPGPRNGESDVAVKVASSEPSMNSDNDDVAVLETGVMDAPSGSIKPDGPAANHRRRRTASSGTDVPVTVLQKSILKDLGSPSEASSRAPYTAEPLPYRPTIPTKSSLRNSSLSVSTTGFLGSRQNSVSSSRTSSPARNHVVDRGLNRSSRGSSCVVTRVGSMGSMGGTTSIARNSISDDVLAAWGSLGGSYDGPRA